ncbi:hypothetical protein [Saccharothrix stipae]
MRELTSRDATQEAILPHLRTTEMLLARAASRISGRSRDAEIVPMVDLGIPHNVLRMHGGFFTGAHYRWDTDVPMVPVDATVNVCGVALFKTSTDISSEEEFHGRVRAARKTWEEQTPFSWNFNTGNHFIIYAQVSGEGQLPAGRYLVVHASTAEFKSQFNGLYPSQNNWYSDHVSYLPGPGNRYLRYLSGRMAERFYGVATMLQGYQVHRQRLIAGLVLGEEGVEREVLSVPHYGMPDQSSVAIGCQWLDAASARYLLLTRPHAPLYLIEAHDGGSNGVRTEHGDRLLTPHGLGVRSTGTDVSIEYLPDSLLVSGKRLSRSESLRSAGGMSIRNFDREYAIGQVLKSCPGTVEDELTQIYSYFWEGNK